VWMGTGLGAGLAWLNSSAPIVFAILIPLLYPFLVPLGLHWPLNALMLINIQTLGYDFIQGPMGAWNFACFGATAGVLFLSMRDRDVTMRQTATGALIAGLFGGISEPSLYGIHLRFKRIYPRMLVGCLVGGVITGVFGGVKTSAFAFTSLLTIPVFSPIALYSISIAAAFATAMVLVVISDFRTPDERAAFLAERDQAEADHALAAATTDKGHAVQAVAHVAAPVAPATAFAASAPIAIGSPMTGRAIALSEVNDKVFASKVLGDGVGVVPTDGHVVSPVTGVLLAVPKSGHAFGIKTDDGVEVLVHVGIDTVRLKGEHFTVAVQKGQHVTAGDLLVKVNLDGIREAGFDTTTVVVITNTKALGSVAPVTGVDVRPGDTIINVTH